MLNIQYAAVEIQRDPTLKGKAFGVGGGVLCTASVSHCWEGCWGTCYLSLHTQYEARKYGCRSGMAGFVARKLCPHIIM